MSTRRKEETHDNFKKVLFLTADYLSKDVSRVCPTDVAILMGVSQQVVNNWRVRGLPLKKLWEFCEIVKCEFHFIIGTSYERLCFEKILANKIGESFDSKLELKTNNPEEELKLKWIGTARGEVFETLLSQDDDAIEKLLTISKIEGMEKLNTKKVKAILKLLDTFE